MRLGSRGLLDLGRGVRAGIVVGVTSAESRPRVELGWIRKLAQSQPRRASSARKA